MDCKKIEDVPQMVFHFFLTIKDILFDLRNYKHLKIYFLLIVNELNVHRKAAALRTQEIT